MTKERKYIDFKLELRDVDTATDTFRVSVLPSDAGVVGDTPAVSVPYHYEDLEWLLSDLDRKMLSIEDVVSLGKELTTRLLPPGPVRDLYMQAIAQIGQDDGIRLRLIIRSPLLAQLPWEFAYDPMRLDQATRDHFLVLNPQISIVRYESRPVPPSSLLAQDPYHLRMVAATANVKGMRTLKLDQERKIIEGALSDFDVDGVTISWQPFIEDATCDDLVTALRKGADLFHFAGHGLFELQEVDPESNEPMGEGQLVLLKDKSTKERTLLAAKELAGYLQAAGVRLAVLGACKTGRRDRVSPWTGIAPALLEKGIPAVVAMQYEVEDNAALAFSKAFYTSLAAGLSVDEAVSTGRREMSTITALSLDKNVEWGVPVLYMRSPDGVIFPKLAARPSPTADKIRLEAKAYFKTIEEGAHVTVQKLNLARATGNIDARSTSEAETVKGYFVGQEVNFGDDDKSTRGKRSH